MIENKILQQYLLGCAKTKKKVCCDILVRIVLIIMDLIYPLPVKAR